MRAASAVLLATMLSLGQISPAAAQSSSTASMVALAERADTGALLSAVKRQPDEARAAIIQLMTLSTAPAPDHIRAARLAAATRVAQAYSEVWRDSFPERQLSTFITWPPERRAAKVAVDSLRRMGVEESRRLGVRAGIRYWHSSLRRAASIRDSAGAAAAMGNIGAGLFLEGELDSAETYLVRARDLASAAGDLRTAGNALGTLASVSLERGDYARALHLYEQAAGWREQIGDIGGLAADRNNIGLVAQELGDLAGARRAFEGALEINRRYERDVNAATNLVNLANVATLDGDYSRASSLYGEALATFEKHDAAPDAASVQHRMGQLALRRGEYVSARALLLRALSTYEKTGPSAEAVAVLRDLALAASAMGNLQGALSELLRAEQRAAADRASPALLADMAMTRADLAVRMNTLAEADREYARADRLYRGANDAAGQADALQGRGLLLLRREDYVGALAALQAAERAQAGAGDRRAAAITALVAGYAQRKRGDSTAARRTLHGALAALRGVGDVVGEAAALAALGDLELQVGAASAAESLYTRGLMRLGTRTAPSVAWQLHAGLAEALRDRGALGEAVRELRAAIAQVERVSSTLLLEERRGAYLDDKWSLYAQLALVERSRRRDGEAFAASERMRARQMLDLLARGRIAPSTGEDSLRAREHDLRRRIHELTNAMEARRSPSAGLRGPIVSTNLEPTRDALDRAQRAYGDLLLVMRERSPRYARLVTGESVGWREVAERLGPDEAFVEYLVSDSASVAFVVTRRGVTAVDLYVGRRSLATLVEFARANLSRVDDGRALWRSPMRRLHQQLITPLEAAGQLDGVRTLIIAPHAELHYLPFAALVRPSQAGRREEFLVERYRVTYTPSASVWLTEAEDRSPSRGSGVLALAPRVQALPGSRDEVAAIGRIYGPHATVLTDAAASKRAFLAAAPQADVIHLATYGVLNKANPLFSFVELAPSHGNESRLEVHELFGLSVSARLVVLSACQTALGSGALGDVPAGDDWIGLVRGFLFAGAANVMATLWPVEDRTTARLMERFHVSLAGGRSEADALADMQRSALSDAATAHPFHWAGFALFSRRAGCATETCSR